MNLDLNFGLNFDFILLAGDLVPRRQETVARQVCVAKCSLYFLVRALVIALRSGPWRWACACMLLRGRLDRPWNPLEATSLRIERNCCAR